MSLTKAKVSAVGKEVTPGGVEMSARRGESVQVGLTHEIEIELTESEPTIQQQQAYERFWKLFIERLVRERQLNKTD